MKKEINLENIPFQVSDIIGKLLHSKDNDRIKDNYKVRLIDIRDAINAALTQFDEASTNRDNFFRKPKRK